MNRSVDLDDAMPSDGGEISAAWAQTQQQLPAGWTLDSLRCVSTGLNPSDRSDDWIAVALRPDGQSRAYRAHDAVAALKGLGASFEGH